jgi:hypothetical protein
VHASLHADLLQVLHATDCEYQEWLHPYCCPFAVLLLPLLCCCCCSYEYCFYWLLYQVRCCICSGLAQDI